MLKVRLLGDDYVKVPKFGKMSAAESTRIVVQEASSPSLNESVWPITWSHDAFCSELILIQAEASSEEAIFVASTERCVLGILYCCVHRVLATMIC